MKNKESNCGVNTEAPTELLQWTQGNDIICKGKQDRN